MAGDPPDGSADWKEFAEKIPLYASVNAAALYEGDAQPFHLVLDVFKVGAISSNGLLYDEELVTELEKQLPGTGGLRGHLPLEQYYSAFPIEEIHWVGHTRLGDTTYAKAYVAPGETREFMRKLIARGGKLRTSIDVVARQEARGKSQYVLREPQLQTLDLAPAKKAALRDHQSGNPIITQQMAQQEEQRMDIQFADVPQHIREQIIREAQVQADAKRVTELQQQVTTLTTERDTARADVTRLQGEVTTRETRITELTNRVSEFERTQFEQQIDAALNALTASWQVHTEAGKAKVAALVGQVRKAALLELGNQRETAQIQPTVQRLWTQDYKVFVEMTRDVLAGPAGAIGGQGNSDWRETFATADGQKAAKEKVGF